MKILCLGNNGVNTDNFVTKLAKSSVNNGLIEDPDFIPTQEGYYHTSIADINFSGIVKLSKRFDKIQMLDQPHHEWSSWKLLLSTYKVCKELDAQGINIDYLNNQNIKPLEDFSNLVVENKSFCIYPWINFIEEQGKNVLCARSTHKKVCNRNDAMSNWDTNPEYVRIRNQMLNEERVNDHCTYCYDLEDKGIESYRQFETKEWAAKLNLQSIDDVKKITHPYYYEIRLSNKCNLMCRGCRPEFSHLIKNEFEEHNIVFPQEQIFKYSSLDVYFAKLD